MSCLKQSGQAGWRPTATCRPTSRRRIITIDEMTSPSLLRQQTDNDQLSRLLLGMCSIMRIRQNVFSKLQKSRRGGRRAPVSGRCRTRRPSVVSTITMSILRTVRWGMIGCGDVAEVKSGPGFQRANGSALVAVMRRDRVRAEDFATRHSIPRVYSQADALIDDPEVDAVYVATPPSSHCELALRVARAGKPCLVEKPMAINHAECVRMVEAFRR